jgi:hypothetical protein
LDDFVCGTITKERIKNILEEKEDPLKSLTICDIQIIKEFPDEQNRFLGFHRVYSKRTTGKTTGRILLSLIALILPWCHELS